MVRLLITLTFISCAPSPEVAPVDGDTDTEASPAETGASDTGDTGAIGVVDGPQRYTFGAVHSPITPWVADHIRGISEVDPSSSADVFMKVGASSLDSSNSLNCVSGLDLSIGGRDHLAQTVAFFSGGDAAGTTPWERESVAAVSGRTAAWSMDGSPSPIETEMSAISPRYALVHYGTNDMGMGTTYASAMPGFYEAYSGLVNQLMNLGVVPVLATISHRRDRLSADHWVPTYNNVIRGVAQREQVPLVDWWLALDELPGKGLAGDGLHVEPHPDGACLFTDDGLTHGYNVRNLLSVEAFDRVKRVAVDGEQGMDPPGKTLSGSGAPNEPFVVDGLPFVHHDDTSTSPWSSVHEYSCDDADESGPELTYELSVEQRTSVRVVVASRGLVDPDIHLLTAAGDGSSCVERAHRVMETTLDAGTWYIAVDSWTDDGGVQRSGEYLLSVVECDPDDPDC